MARAKSKTPDFVIRQMKERIEKAVDKGLDRAAEKGVQIAKDLSSGSVSSAQLRKMDHPFATRHASPKLAPEVINKQSGLFRNKWHLRKGGSRAIVNDAPYADFLKQGTRFMHRRPIVDSVEKLFEPIAAESIQRELKKLEK